MTPQINDRPFPFDHGTIAEYESKFWRGRTGIGQLAQVLFLRECDRIIMLAFYGDGSGEHGKGTFVVAGYIGNMIDLFEMERLWSAELARDPKIDYFKASECIYHQNRGGFGKQFNGWTQTAVDAKRLRLAEVVKSQNHRIAEVSCAVHWDDYRFAINNGPSSEAYYSPYFFCFLGVAHLAISVSNDLFFDHDGRIAFVLDTESDSIDEDSKAQFDLVRKFASPESSARMGSTTWDTDIKFPILQIADLLAWSIRAQDEGLSSPVLSVLRDRPVGSPGGGYRKRLDINGLAETIIDLDERVRARYIGVDRDPA